LTLDEYLVLDHIVVSPLGRPRHVDSVLAERGLERRIRRIVPFFISGLLLAATTDSILTVSHRAAESMAATLHLRILEPPLPLSAYALNLLWHPRLENEPANQWLREVFVRAAAEAAPESSQDAVGAAPGRSRTRKPR
jgi:DNA-binding transcriptional LysR family regulator